MTIVSVPGLDLSVFLDNNNQWNVASIVDQPEGDEDAGAAYLVSAFGTGEFATFSNDYAILSPTRGWTFIGPTVGKLAYVANADATYQWNGSQWVEISGSGTGGGNLVFTNVSTDYQVQPTDSRIRVNASGGARTIKMPLLSASGAKQYKVYRATEDTSSNLITVQRNDADSGRQILARIDQPNDGLGNGQSWTLENNGLTPPAWDVS